MELGKKIYQLRKLSGMTQEQLAELCDISSTYISHIETGIAKVSLDVLHRISLALSVTPDYFLLDTVKPPDYVMGEIASLLKKCDPQTLYTASQLIETLVSIQNEK